MYLKKKLLLLLTLLLLFKNTIAVATSVAIANTNPILLT